jgi:hypothetical protein
MAAHLYHGLVMHSRLGAVRHRFQMRVFSLAVDLDALPAVARRLRFFSYNRANLVSLHDRDHGDRPGEPIAAWARRTLAEHGLADFGRAIQLVCFPRVLGHMFKPLSLFFCRDAEGRLGAVLYEVHNTFGGRHAYVLPVPAGQAASGIVAQRCGKAFYVSPFIPMDAEYSFRVKPPAAIWSLLIRERVAEGEILRASISGRRAPLTDAALLKALVYYPFMGIKVVAGIHWHALRLWLKGARYHRPPGKAPVARPRAALGP